MDRQQRPGHEGPSPLPVDVDRGYQLDPPNGRFRIFEKLDSNRPKINIILFVATFISTFLSGWLPSRNWQDGLWYSLGILSILLAHEMGHYVMCRRHGIRATLPYFIPFPLLNPFGTMGAVIKMESRLPSRKALFDVAVAGPLAGLVFTVPCIYYGVQLSEIIDIKTISEIGAIRLGESLLYSELSRLAVGQLAEGQDIMLHPLAYAGWAGLFVTALNLLPIGQLDGGHIVYALFGKYHRYIARASLLGFALVCVLIYPWWGLMLVLLLFLGHGHPPTADERPVDKVRFVLGILTLILFAVSFTPQPFM